MDNNGPMNLSGTGFGGTIPPDGSRSELPSTSKKVDIGGIRHTIRVNMPEGAEAEAKINDVARTLFNKPIFGFEGNQITDITVLNQAQVDAMTGHSQRADHSVTESSIKRSFEREMGAFPHDDGAMDGLLRAGARLIDAKGTPDEARMQHIYERKIGFYQEHHGDRDPAFANLQALQKAVQSAARSSHTEESPGVKEFRNHFVDDWGYKLPRLKQFDDLLKKIDIEPYDYDEDDLDQAVKLTRLQIRNDSELNETEKKYFYEMLDQLHTTLKDEIGGE